MRNIYGKLLPRKGLTIYLLYSAYLI